MEAVLVCVSLLAVLVAIAAWWVVLRRPPAQPQGEALGRAARDAVVRTLADPVLVLDSSGRLLEANPAGARFLERLSPSEPDRPFGDVALEDAPGDQTRELVVDASPMQVQLTTTALTVDAGQSGQVVVVTSVEPLHRRSQDLTRAHRDLVRDCERTERRRADLAGLTVKDTLTGLARRRELPRALQVMCDDSSADFALLVLDVDRLDLINQVHGYAVGDLLLAAIGRVLREATRVGDVVVRFGGEEFVVLMRAGDLEAVRARAEDLRAACAAIRVGGPEARVTATVSVGAALSRDVERSPRALQRAADRALWTAKRAGRDRVVLYQRDDIASVSSDRPLRSAPTRFGTGSRGRID